MTKKIVISGSTGSGKTSLLNALPDEKGIIKISDISQRILDANSRAGLAPDFLDRVLKQQLLEEQWAEKQNPELIICDRGYIDVMVAAKLKGVSLDEEVLASFKPYDLVFHCDARGMPPIPEHLYFEQNYYRQEVVDIAIRDTIEKEKLCAFISRGSIDERLRQFRHAINSLVIFHEGQRRGKER